MLFGFIILGLGILLLLDIYIPNLNIDFSIVWPCVLIFVSIYQMIKNKVFNVSMILLFYVGAFFLVKNANFVSVDISNLFFPLLLIIVGLLIIFDRFINKNTYEPKVDKEGRLNYLAVFSEVKEKVHNENFKGAKITSFFGGVDLDLSEVNIKNKEIVIDVNSIFGGSNLIMPKGCHVVFNSSAVFGANENKYDEDDSKKNITIYINCYSIFGGTEVK